MLKNLGSRRARFTAAALATTALAVAFTVPLPTQPQGVLFVVRRQAAGAATVLVVVTDTCGPWPTFVGLGAGVP